LLIADCCRDPRHPAAPLRKHTSTHSDDITSVHFSRPSSSSSADELSRHLLLSGSTDGLVCISDAKEQDEDEAVVYVGNLGSSISQTGWMPSRGGERTTGVWAATDMETFSVWSDEVRNAKSSTVSLNCYYQKASFFLTGFLSFFPPARSPQQQFGYS
jgi:WD repeat-containing protein 89